MLFLNTAAAIVLYVAYSFILPRLFAVGAEPDGLVRARSSRGSTSPTPRHPIIDADVSGKEWAQLATSGLIWLVLPLADRRLAGAAGRGRSRPSDRAPSVPPVMVASHERAIRRAGRRPAPPRDHHPQLARPRRRLGAGRVRPDAGAVRRLGLRGRAALAQGLRARLGHGGVRHAPRLHQHPHRPRVGARAGSAAAPTRSAGWSAARCARSSTTRPSARTPSSSTATSSRPTAAPARRRSPARTSRWPTPCPTCARRER